MTAVWDDTNFGAVPLFRGYSAAPRSNILHFETEIADGKRRRIYSGNYVRDISFEKKWSFAQFRLFVTWFETDLNEGVTDFTMSDTVMGDTGTFKLDLNAPWVVTDFPGPGHLTVTINARRVS